MRFAQVNDVASVATELAAGLRARGHTVEILYPRLYGAKLPPLLKLAVAPLRLLDWLRLAARPAWVQTMVWLIVLVLGLTGAPRALGVLNPETLLLWPADLPALRWAAAATPPESLFAVNLRLWQTGIYTGTDGGYWLPVLAGRPALVPPPVYVHGPAARERHARLAVLAAAQADPARYLALARAAGAQYLFVGARGGPLPLDLLDRQPGLRLVYSDGRVRVYWLAD